ncbi:hypothetical protein M0802_009735 [Mischocyttarus mexicanus]|nr:hypothetical protein M0802_009735 [Mischocyttarus mexicanus]
MFLLIRSKRESVGDHIPRRQDDDDDDDVDVDVDYNEALRSTSCKRPVTFQERIRNRRYAGKFGRKANTRTEIRRQVKAEVKSSTKGKNRLDAFGDALLRTEGAPTLGETLSAVSKDRKCGASDAGLGGGSGGNCDAAVRGYRGASSEGAVE